MPQHDVYLKPNHNYATDPSEEDLFWRNDFIHSLNT